MPLSVETPAPPKRPCFCLCQNFSQSADHANCPLFSPQMLYNILIIIHSRRDARCSRKSRGNWCKAGCPGGRRTATRAATAVYWPQRGALPTAAQRPCAEGALRGGAGLVYLASVEPVVQMVLARTPECCACGCRTAAGGASTPGRRRTAQLVCRKHAVLLAGPGLGGGRGSLPCPAGQESVVGGCGAGRRRTERACGGQAAGSLAGKYHPDAPPRRGRATTGCTAADAADREQAVLRLAETYHCVAVLKGSGTLIAAPGGSFA